MAIVLTQTDTTVGLLSQDEMELYRAKSRDTQKPFLKVFDSFSTFKEDTLRIPKSQKKFVRRSKKTTFVVKNKAFRVAKLPLHSSFLRELSWHYSTSANKAGESFSREFTQEVADVIVENEKGLYEAPSSKLYKINAKKRVRLR